MERHTDEPPAGISALPQRPIEVPVPESRISAATTGTTANGVSSAMFSAERVLLAILVAGVAFVRLAMPDVLEPNVSTAEAAQLTAVEGLITGDTVSLLGRAGLGASGLALMPVALLHLVRPQPELALRLYAALGSVAFVMLFYVLCRRRYTPVISLAATALLAFNPWSTYFGRNGELNAFVGCWAIVAMLALQRAMRGGGPRLWLAAGAAATAGLYWHPSAIWILPALCVPIICTAVSDSRVRLRLIVALCVFVAAGLLVAAPRVPGLLAGPLSTPAMLTAEGAPANTPTSLRTRAQATVRAFVLLDPSVPGDARYQPAAASPLDALTGLLLLAGIGLSAWRGTSSAIPLAMFLVPLLGSQMVSPRVPTVGDALVALPGLYLLAAETLTWLVTSLPFASITRAVILAAIPAYALFGWQTYTGWIGTAASAQARQPALDYDEVDTWIGEQRSHLSAGQPPLSAKQWREEHPRLTTGSRIIRRPREATPLERGAALTLLTLRSDGLVQGEGGARAARGVAATPGGEVFTSDQHGRISRMDPGQQRLIAVQSRMPNLEQVSDMAADADGFLYVADAERSLLLKLAPTGEVVATLGREWGMYRPRGIGVGPDNRIYVADTGRNRVVVGEPSGRLVKSITPPASFGAFEQPTEVAVDQSGRIYVGLPEIGRLAVLDDSGQVLGGWSIPKGNTIESSRIAVVTDGAIVMSDPAQGKLRLFDADGRELAQADAPGRPFGVAVASARVYVAESAGGRLLQFALGE